ncbi:MAG: SulP family inorganic anion transporter [Bacteriovoracia bacterium]
MTNFSYWKYDLKSSLVVFLVALPLCLGIALASGAPLASGLLAGMVGGIVVGALSDSSLSVSGPAAGLTVIVAAAISDFGSFNIFTLSVFFAGLIQVLFSFANGGSIGDYFPTSVIKGMLAAIGLILILKQFPHAVGYDADYFGDESFYQIDGQNTFSEILMAIKSTHTGSIIVAFISFVIILLWEKLALQGKTFFQLVPGPLIAVIVSIITNELFKFAPALLITDKHLVQLPFAGGFDQLVAGLSGPDWSSLTNKKVYITALVIAIVASIESLLSVEAADKLDEQGRVSSKNRELFAQGVGNTICGLIGALPVTAVIVRTSANITAGARSKLSTVLHGFWLIGCVVAIPHVLNLIPLSCLAVILILVGYKLTKPALIKSMYQRGWNQFVPFAVTILAILFTDLLVGIMIGMVVGFYFVIRSSVHKSVVMVNEGNHYLIRFYKDVSFLQKGTLTRMLLDIPAHSSVVIDGSRSVFVDDDISEIIEDFMKRARSSDIAVELKKSTLALNRLFKEESHG